MADGFRFYIATASANRDAARRLALELCQRGGLCVYPWWDFLDVHTRCPFSEEQLADAAKREIECAQNTRMILLGPVGPGSMFEAGVAHACRGVAYMGQKPTMPDDWFLTLLPYLEDVNAAVKWLSRPEITMRGAISDRA